MLSKVVGRPVKYVEDRLDNLSCCDHHGSERSYDVELAVDADGLFTGLRLDVVDDYGAYIQFGLGTHGNAMAQVVGPYRIQAIEYRARGVFTNKCQQGAYRGFGSEVHNFVLERMVDLAARELDADPIDLRRRNFIQPESSRTRSRAATSTTAATTMRCSTRRSSSPTSRGCGASRSGSGRKAATSASASSRARSAASTRRTNGGSSTGARASSCRAFPRASRSASTRPAASPRPSTRRPSGATAPRRWSRNASPRSSASSPRA